MLLVDDWIKSGTQVAGAIQLIEGQGASVAAVMSLNVEVNQVTQPLLERFRFLSIMRNGSVQAQLHDSQLLEPTMVEQGHEQRSEIDFEVKA